MAVSQAEKRRKEILAAKQSASAEPTARLKPSPQDDDALARDRSVEDLLRRRDRAKVVDALTDRLRDERIFGGMQPERSGCRRSSRLEEASRGE